MKTILLIPKGSLLLRHIFFVVLLLTVISPTQVFAQDVKEEWARQFGSHFASTISTIHLAVDEAGNSYVTGTIQPAQGSIERIVTVKYSPAGEELWVAYYSSPFQADATGIAVDKNGDVYVVGSDDAYTTSRGSALILKYNGDDGTKLWQKRHNPVQASRGLHILLDDQGNVFVVGQTTLAFNIFFLSKLDPADGSVVWNRILTGTGNEENYPNNLLHFNDFALDDGGDVYVTGAIGYPLPAQDLIVVKYSGADGQTMWRKSYASGDADEGLEIIVDKEAAYVAGRSSKLVAPSPINTAFIIKYDITNGEQVWFKPIVEDLIAITNINDLHISNDAIYFVGLREIYRNPTQYFLISYSTSVGEQNWATPMAGVVADLEADLPGDIYVTSTEATEKYSGLNGQLLWSASVPNSTKMEDMAIDSNLNVFISGLLFSQSNGQDILTIKYNQQGTDLLCFDPLQVQLSLPPHAVRVGEQVLTTANFGDYVPGEAHNIRWIWGDQSQPTIAYFATGDSHITGEHTYTQAGIYRVGLDFSESCLVAANDVYKEWLVIYDPNAGSVTGGGQLLSLETSLPWMSQQLNAQYSFNVRYNQNKETAPQGQMQLNLRQQGVFRSNALDWLVVSGDQALWQGTGTLNGKGNYGFVASVWDGRGTGADDAGDELRIRIWDKNTDNTIVYDNFETAGDIYDMTNPTSRIVRGQVIIHSLATASKTTNQQATLYNYPNTFKAKTTITFTADKAGVYRLEVYDMRGKLVKQLWEGQAEEGQNYSLELDGTSLPKGIYVARLVSSTGSQSIKMLIER